MVPWRRAARSLPQFKPTRHRLEVELDPIPHPGARKTQESQDTRIQTTKSTGQSNTNAKKKKKERSRKKRRNNNSPRQKQQKRTRRGTWPVLGRGVSGEGGERSGQVGGMVAVEKWDRGSRADGLGFLLTSPTSWAPGWVCARVGERDGHPPFPSTQHTPPTTTRPVRPLIHSTHIQSLN
jgi:hypothetical protein